LCLVIDAMTELGDAVAIPLIINSFPEGSAQPHPSADVITQTTRQAQGTRERSNQ
jgi:hypothetical protein